MPAVFVGHGGRDPGSNIVVPPGVSIRFFVDYDLNLDPTNAEAVLSRGDFGSPNQEYASGAPVPNYVMSPLTAEEMQTDMTAAASLTNVVWVDARTSLCTTPGVCGPLPAHTCDGLLGRAAASGENVVVFLACRGVIGGDAEMAQRLGKPGTNDSVNPEFDAWVDDFLARAQNDAAAAAAEWDGLPEATRAMLLTYNDIRDWSVAREASNPSAPAAVLEARRYLDSHGEGALADWMDQWDDTQRRVVMADADLAAAYQRGVDARTTDREKLLGSEAGAPAADPIAPLAATVRGEATAIAAAVASLTGSDADANAVAELTMAFQTFMGDADSLQRLAEQQGRQDVLVTAANLVQQGANAAMQLAVFSEMPDAENLATLSSAVGAAAQWADSLG